MLSTWKRRSNELRNALVTLDPEPDGSRVYHHQGSEKKETNGMITPFTYFLATYTAISVYKAGAYFWMKVYDDAFKEFAKSPLFKPYEDDEDN